MSVQLKIVRPRTVSVPNPLVDLRINSGPLDPAMPQPFTASGPSKLASLIKQTLFNPQAHSLNRKHLNLTFKFILSLGGIAGRIPFFPLTLKAGGDNQALGIFYATTGQITFSAYFVWASFRMTNRLTYELALDESSKQKNNAAKKAAKIALIALCACAAQIPALALAYFYNRNQPYIILLNLMDFVLPMHSIELLWQSYISPLKYNPVEKQLYRLKNDIVARMATNHQAYLFNLESQTKLNALLSEYASAREDECFSELLNNLLKVPPRSEEVTSLTGRIRCYNATLTAASLAGLILTGILLAYMGLLAHQGSNELTKNEAASYFIAAFVVLCNLVLTRLVLAASSRQGMRSLINILSCRTEHTYASEALYPYFSIALKIFCCSLSILVFPSFIQNAQDEFSPEFQLPAGILISAGYAILSYLPLRDLTDWSIIEYVRNHGAIEPQTMVRNAEIIQNIIDMFDSATPLTMAKFLKDAPGDIFNHELLTKHGLTLEAVERFLVS